MKVTFQRVFLDMVLVLVLSLLFSWISLIPDIAKITGGYIKQKKQLIVRNLYYTYISSVQSLSHVRLFVTP